MKKSKTVSFASSIMKNICVLPSQSRFPVKLTCFIVFGSASNFFSLLKSIAISLIIFLKRDNLVSNLRNHHLDQ